MAEQAVDGNGESAEQVPEKRDMSTIRFAYLSLDEAAAIAIGVHAVGGPSCQLDQLAAHLNLKSDTGSFRLKLGQAKLFGFITHSSGMVSLTGLGSRLCDSQQEQSAKAEAFLNIPLYKQIYEQFKGTSLPPPAGLETAMVNMGVAPKQKVVARQVFTRSASQAGFFAYGNNRLVQPAIKGSAISNGIAADGGTPPAPEIPSEKPHYKGGRDGGGGGGGDLHPLIEGLIKALPKEDKEWPMEKRAKWLRAAAQNFDIIYPDIEDGASIEIKVQKGQSQ